MSELTRSAIRGGNRPVSASELRQLIDRIIERFQKASENVARVEVVTALPDRASPQQLFRLVSEPGRMYVGNGPNRPLAFFDLTSL